MSGQCRRLWESPRGFAGSSGWLQTQDMHFADVIGAGLLVVIVVPMVVGIGRAIRRHLAGRAGR